MKTGGVFCEKSAAPRERYAVRGASGETYKTLCGDETGYGQKQMRGIQLLQAHGVSGKVGVSVDQAKPA